MKSRDRDKIGGGHGRHAVLGSVDGEVRLHRPLEGHEVARTRMIAHFAFEKCTARLNAK